MVLDRDRDDAVAGAAGPRLPLTGKAHLGAGFDPGGEFQVDRRPIRQRDALRRLRRGVDERDRQAISDIGAFLRRRAAPAEAAERPAAAATTEQAFEYVAEVGAVVAEATLRARIAAKTAASAAIPEGHGGIAVAVDLAAVILRALRLVG